MEVERDAKNRIGTRVYQDSSLKYVVLIAHRIDQKDEWILRWWKNKIFFDWHCCHSSLFG